ncbi:unnamed protein product [Protopolystoma xenopodis]|uniref:Uncharacterized protein n=1 Tax=Protopolystoma xenopodis TaxID=117903 RepID=A0A3S5B1D0_9PLAT|nr:unnamed protein product [Protopolystoma xenopodis]
MLLYLGGWYGNNLFSDVIGYMLCNQFPHFQLNARNFRAFSSSPFLFTPAYLPSSFAQLPRDQAVWCSAGVMGSDGCLYLVGGRKDGLLASALTHVYNPSTRCWTAGPLLNQPRCEFSLCQIEPKIYAIAGLYTAS